MANNPEASITVKMLTDDFKKGAKELKNETSTLNREFKLQSEQMKLTASETDKLEARINYLTQRQDIARRSVEQSQTAYNQAVQLFGENSKAAQDMAKALDNAKIDEQKLKNELVLTNAALTEQTQTAGVTADTFNGDFKSSMKELDSEAEKLRRSFNLQEEQMRLTASESEKYSTKLEYLNDQHEVASRRVDETAAQFERVQEQFGANSQEAEDMAQSLNDAQLAEQQLANQIQETNSQLQEHAQNIESASSGLDDLAVNASAVGKKLTDTGKDLSMKLTAPVVGLGIAAVKTGADFEAQMDRVGAIASATSEEMEQMKNVALELGASTSKSAGEVAKGMEELAAMGFTANEVIGAMPGVISAAEASGSDMAQTAEVMASTLNIFNLEAEEAGKVADILAQTANVSAASLTDMQYALKYAGPPASALGVSLEELSAGIGIMTNAGMKGEQAGTTLRGALLGLLDPSEENSKLMDKMGIAITDNEGNFVGLANLVDNLANSMDGQTDTQKAATISALVGKEAVSGMLSLMQAGPDEIREFTKSLEESGGASETAAAIMRDNLTGTLDELGGAFETASIEIAEILTPAIREISEGLQSLIQKFIDLSPTAQKVILTVTGLVAAIGPLLIVFGAIASAIGSLLTVFATISGAITVMTTGAAAATPAIGALATVFTFLTGPIGIAIAAIAAIIAILVLAYAKVEWFREAVKAVWEAIKQATIIAFEAIKKTISTIIGEVVKFAKSQLDVFKKFWDENGKQISSMVKFYFEQVGATIKMVMGIIKGLFEITWPLISSTVRYAWETIKLIISTAIDLVLGIIQVGLKIMQGDWKGAGETIVKTVKSMGDNIVKFLKGINLKQTGKDIIQGLVNGIGSMATAVRDKVKSITDGIKKAITGALDIHSPSRVTRGYGVNVGEGFELGLGDRLRSIVAAGKKLANAVKQPMDNFNFNGGQFTGVFDQQQSRLAKVSDAIVPPQPIYIQVVSELDGQAVASNQYQYLNGMTTRDYNIERIVRGY